MTVNTLNRIVALLLSGGAALLLVTVIHWSQLSVVLPLSESSAGGGVWVLIGLTFFPFAALSGAVIEGLSEVTVQRLVKKVVSYPIIARILCRSKGKDDLDHWLERLEEVLPSDSSLWWLRAESLENQEWWRRSAVAGTFLQRSTPDQLRWLLEHYSTFVLAANMALVVGGGIIYAAFASAAAGFGWWWPVLVPLGLGKKVLALLAGLGSLWALLSLSVGRYLYSHELAARYVALLLGGARTDG